MRKLTNIISRPFLIIIFTVFIYVIMVKPFRVMVNQKVFYPVMSEIFSGYDIIPAPNKSTAVVIKHKPIAQEGTEVDQHDLWFSLPFDGLFIIPFVLLVYIRKWKLVKQFTLYHVIISLLPILFLLPVLNLNSIIPMGIFQKLNIVLCFVYTVLGVKNVSQN